jgi:hypothetical protein
MRYIISLVLTVFLLSCKKEDLREPQFPSELFLTSIKKKQGIRLFTNKREITDPKAINDFVKGSTYFGIRDSLVNTNEKITFKSIDSAFVGSNPNPYTIESRGDTLKFFSALGGSFTEEVARLLYPMSRYRGKLVYSPFSGYMAQNIMIGYGNYNRLNLSVYSYKLTRANKFVLNDEEHVFRSGYAGKTFNEFDTSYINRVLDTDTLAIEEYSFIFEKR